MNNHRQAQLSGDQIRILRSGRNENSDLAPLAPAPLPGVAPAGRGAPAGPRPRRATDEPTTARPPMPTNEVPTLGGNLPGGLPGGIGGASDARVWLAIRIRCLRDER